MIPHSLSDSTSFPVSTSGKQADNVNVKPSKKKRPGERPTPKCQKCGKTVLLANRLVHIVGHLSRDDGIYRFRCRHCEYGSGFTGSMRYHLRTQHNTKEGIVDRVGDLTEDIERMSLICYHSPVVMKVMPGTAHQPTIFRASWPRDSCRGRRRAPYGKRKKETINETPDADDTLRDGDETRDDEILGIDESEMDVGTSDQSDLGLVADVKNENQLQQYDVSEFVKYWVRNQSPHYEFPEEITNSSPIVLTDGDEVEMSCDSGKTVPLVGNANNVAWRPIDGVKQEVDLQPKTQVQLMLENPGETIRPNVGAISIGDRGFLDDEEFYEMHRLQKKWNKEELADNVRIVARRMECSEERIALIVNILEKNDMDGIALSFEDENLTNFFGQCNVAYGARSVMIQILRKMKIGQLNN